MSVPKASNLVCPECRKPLLAIATISRQANPAVWVVLLALLLLGGGFRFRFGSSELDNKALENMGRVTGFLADLHYAPQDVPLLDFSDATGRDKNRRAEIWVKKKNE